MDTLLLLPTNVESPLQGTEERAWRGGGKEDRSGMEGRWAEALH